MFVTVNFFLLVVSYSQSVERRLPGEEHPRGLWGLEYLERFCHEAFRENLGLGKTWGNILLVS